MTVPNMLFHLSQGKFFATEKRVAKQSARNALTKAKTLAAAPDEKLQLLEAAKQQTINAINEGSRQQGFDIYGEVRAAQFMLAIQPMEESITSQTVGKSLTNVATKVHRQARHQASDYQFSDAYQTYSANQAALQKCIEAGAVSVENQLGKLIGKKEQLVVQSRRSVKNDLTAAAAMSEQTVSTITNKNVTVHDYFAGERLMSRANARVEDATRIIKGFFVTASP